MMTFDIRLESHQQQLFAATAKKRGEEWGLGFQLQEAVN
jgi:hypothetical protein